MTKFLVALSFIFGLSGLVGGYQFGKHKTTAEFLAVQNSDLRESRKEVERQIEQVSKTQKAYDEQIRKIDESERRYRNADRLRKQADRKAAIATASAETCRVYAATVTDILAECRETVVELGHEAERGRTAIEALKSN